LLVKGDLEGFFLIIVGGLMDTFLQNPPGNPLANKPVLEWFPSFGPMQFAVGGAFARTALWRHLALGAAWAGARRRSWRHCPRERAATVAVRAPRPGAKCAHGPDQR
jgi:hypothetical protein